MNEAVKLGFAGFSTPRDGVLVVFCDDDLKFGPATRKAIGGAADLIARAAKAENFKGKRASALDLAMPHGLDVARLIVIGTGKASELKERDFITLGGTALGKVPSAVRSATIFAEFSSGAAKPDQTAELALGARLRGYSFDRYKTKLKEGETKPAPKAVTIAVADAAAARKAYASRAAIGEGVLIARDLVNEPANVLYPEEFARRAAMLRKQRVAVEILDVKAMKKLGMNALLGVGQGSRRDSRMVVMRWNGGKKNEAPVAIHRQGRVLRHRRHFDQARGRHGRHEGRHGRRRLRGRPDACARGAQCAGQCDRRDRMRRKYAGRQCATSRRHRHIDVGPDHRDHQYRRRRPARSRRCALVHRQALQAEIHDRSRDADRRDHRRARS